eukprot:2366646-Amphidinium_carterae.1
MATHVLFRAWRTHCVQGKAKDRPHFKQPSPDGEKEMPKVEFDFCFPSDRVGEHVTVFTAGDQWTQSPMAVIAGAKRPADEYVVRAFLGFVDQLGWTTMKIRCDPEHACVDLARTLKARRCYPTHIHTSPRGSKGSLGMCKATHLQLQGQIRTMRPALEDCKHEVFEFREQLLCAETRHLVALAEGIAGTPQEQQTLASIRLNTWKLEGFAEAMWNLVPMSMRGRHGIATICKLENHGHDAFVVGSRQDMVWFRDWVHTQWVCNVGPLIGLGEQDAREGWFLKRRLWAKQMKNM